jgi:nucleoside-diphosphate-sugar epimerase
MRAFVTGSTGLLGNNLVRTLLKAGHEVVALARSAAKGTRELGDTSARIVIGDMADVAGFADRTIRPSLRSHPFWTAVGVFGGLGTPAGTGSNTGHGGRHRHHVGERGATGGALLGLT